MLRKSFVRIASIHDVHIGRQQSAQQFSAMDGWQSGQDPRFDAYVAKERLKERYEAFDQRVERAYLRSAALHKAEVANGFKRHLKATSAKFTATTLREMNQAVEGRLEWLREVWAQIDTDYRSSDPERQEAASGEISKALRGESSDFMSWAYEKKANERLLGPKGTAAAEAEFQDANLPEISNDEANRYMNLKLNMLEIERQVKTKFGIAGAQHWAMLQEQKDLEYEEKLDKAAEKYKELIDQQQRYDASSSTTHLRNVLERTHEAKVRFQAAMELEREREKMVEAHMQLREERQTQAAERRKMQLRDAAELRAQGKTPDEIAQAMKLRVLDEHIQRHDTNRQDEKRMIQKKKDTFLGLIEKIRRGTEVKEGESLMAQRQQQLPTGGRRRSPPSAFAAYEVGDDGRTDAYTTTQSTGGANTDTFQLTAEERAIMDNAQGLAAARLTQQQRSSSLSSPERSGGGAPTTTMTATALRKQELWQAVHADKWEDPFTTVHQARMDADRNYDQAYAKMLPTDIVLGSKLERQGMGEFAAGNEQDNQILQAGNRIGQALQWDNPHGIVHNLDRDGDKEYFLSDVYHVRDKKTGDIDWRYERRAGGPVFRGPKFYKIGEQREARDPGSRTVDPTPVERNKQQKQQQQEGRGGTRVHSASSPRVQRSS